MRYTQPLSLSLIDRAESRSSIEREGEGASLAFKLLTSPAPLLRLPPPRARSINQPINRHKIVIKVDFIRAKCKAVAMTVVAKIPGVKSLAADEEKGTMTVVGEVDVVQVVSELRKAKFAAEVVSVGPEKEPEKKPEAAPKKPDEPPKKPDPPPPCCPGCNSCRPACQCAAAAPGGGVLLYEVEADGYGCIIA
uniref:HMA domain-containing protein n=1 Tax=Oryza punctata TaxID=4537 RepID=A0A0E0KE83_ORYPU